MSARYKLWIGEVVEWLHVGRNMDSELHVFSELKGGTNTNANMDESGESGNEYGKAENKTSQSSTFLWIVYK